MTKIEIFKLFGSILIDSDKANESISKTGKNAEGMGDKFGKGIVTVGKWGLAIGAAAAGAAVAIGGVALKSAVDFEKQMANVATLLDGDVKSKISNLGEQVKKLSTDTGTSTELLTDGLYQVISAFGETEDSMKILETASKGAAAGNATVTDSVNLLAAVTKGYGDTSAEAANKASDLAFLTVKLGQTSFPELASSMGKVIPLASTMKVRQEELFGAMATLTGVTGGTAEVTTQLRSTIQGFLQPSKDMEKALKGLGYENGQAAIESEGLGGILNKLKDSVGGNEIAFSNLFSSVEAKNAVLALTGAQAENFTEKTKAMENAIGSTNSAFETQQQTVAASMEKIKANINVVAISLGEQLLPVFQEVLDWILQHMPQIQAFIQQAFDYAGVAIEYFTKNILPPLWDGISTLIEWIVQLVDYVKTWVGDNKGQLNTLKDEFMKFFALVKEFIQAFITFAKAYWAEYGDQIMKIAKFAFDSIVGVIKGAFNIIKGLLDFFIGLFTGDWSRMGEGLKKIWDGLWQAIGAVLKGAWNILSSQFQFLYGKIEGWFKGLKDAALNWGKNMIDGFIDGIKAKIQKVKDAVSSVTKAVKGFLGFNSPAKEGEGRHITKWGANMIDGFLDGAASMIPDARSLMNNVVGSMQPQSSGGAGAVTFNFERMLEGANFQVRSDQDIPKLAREIGNYMKTEARRNGVVFG
ncbi:tail tape measure protein [Bacillus phage vB_BhaS-171]|uniref:tail length tape measure protein n=1 Tax=Bacillus phage vB_BhaS-171 TaxID=1775140 RepID=UPI00074487DD|nr:tail length tape measure protein [Bacillus phage vB_BhaS-171]ALY08074.1 tail tape measure protein [Bacillus phage vB_BhaS-171]